MTVNRAVSSHKPGDLEHVVEIFRTYDSVDVYPQPGKALAAGLDGVKRLKGPGEIPRNVADGILHRVETVQGDIQVQLQLKIFRKDLLHPGGSALGEETVGWKIYPADAILGVEKVQNLC